MDPEKLKVVDLRKELQQRGLDTKGNKAALVDRLREALDAEKGDAPTETSPTPAVKDEEPSDEGDPAEEEEPVKEEVKQAVSPKKETPLTPAAKKETPPTPAAKKETPPSPAAKKEQPPASPKKVVKTEIPESPQITAEDKSEEGSNAEEAEEEPVNMETETRGEKRKRDDDDDDDYEENENKEKKRREDSPTKSPEKVANSPAKTPAKSPVKEKLPPKENEPEFDNTKPLLSWFDSDLNLKIDSTNFLAAKPLNEGCFGYVWAGARASHGVASGKVCFEVKITEELKWEDPAEKMQEKTDKVIKDRFKIDRRNKNQDKVDDKPSEGEKKDDKSEDEKKEGEEKMEEESTENSKSAENEGKPEAQMETNAVADEKSGEEATEDDKDDAEAQKDEQAEAEKAIEQEKSEKAIEEEKSERAKLPPIPTHYFRVGFSLLGTSLQLGESKHSYGYESTGKFVTNKEFSEYGITFGVGDVVGAYIDIGNDNVSVTFTVNGAAQPTAITVPRSEFPMENFAMFPHVLCRNFSYEINFGASENPWFPHPEELKEYQFLEAVEQKVAGPQRPEKREECEVLLMVGLPSSGKTHWVNNHLATSEKPYTVIGNNPLFDRMTVDGEAIRSRFKGSWKILVDRMQKCLNQLTDQAALRRRNFIIDQTNVFPNAQRRKLRGFDGFKRKAVVVVCDDEEHARRQKDQRNDYGKQVPESTMYDLKAQMELPQKCEWIEELIFTDLDEEESKKKVKAYNEEANKKGYFKRWQQPRGDKFKNQRGRGGRGGSNRFDRNIRGSNWRGRPAPWSRDMRPSGMQRPGSMWRQPPRGGPRQHEQYNKPRDIRTGSGYGSNRNQGFGRNTSVWQSNGGGSWGSGNSQGGWNASMYGSHGYGAWNQNSGSQSQQNWKYGGGSNQGSYNQGQRGYGQGGYGSSQGYGSNNQGGYSSQSYNSSSQGSYGNYGQQQQPQHQQQQQGWNYYGQYSQQQGWGNNQKRRN